MRRPSDARGTAIVYEKNLVSLPSMSAVLAHRGAWITQQKFAVNWVKLLHGEQRAVFHRPLPVSGELRGEYLIRAVVDKGAERGALVYFDKLLYNVANGDHLCTVSATYFLRADGGAGGLALLPEPLPAVPERAVDFIDEIKTARAPLCCIASTEIVIPFTRTRKWHRKQASLFPYCMDYARMVCADISCCAGHLTTTFHAWVRWVYGSVRRFSRRDPAHGRLETRAGGCVPRPQWRNAVSE